MNKLKNTKYGNRRYRTAPDAIEVEKQDENVIFTPRSRTYGSDAKRSKSYKV